MKRLSRASGFLTIAFTLAAILVYTLGDSFFWSSEEVSPQIETLDQGNAIAAVRLQIFETGIVELSERELRDTRLPFGTFSADALRLTRNGQQVKFHVADRDDDDTGKLYFYAEAITDTLKAPAVYVLQADSGEEMQIEDGTPQEPGESTALRTQRWEENKHFIFQAAADDSWLGELIWAPSFIDVELTDITPAQTSSGQLNVHVWSNNQAPEDPDHHLQLILNGTVIADKSWDGITNVTIPATIPIGVLHPVGSGKKNILELNAPGDTGAAGEAIYVDWIELQYSAELIVQDEQLLDFTSESKHISVANASADALIFNVSNPDAPAVITNAGVEEDRITFSQDSLRGDFLLFEPGTGVQTQLSSVPLYEQSLQTEGLGADYIAIVPDDPAFSSRLAPLLAHRRELGLESRSVTLGQIYMEFGDGVESAESIRDFINYAVDNWEPAPRFVLLVGDATYDPNSFLIANADEDADDVDYNQNILPTHLVFTEYAGYVATDTYFATQPGSLMPRVALGRFPVQTAEQLRILVKKTIDYELADSAEWQSRALLVADDEPQFNVASDTLGASLQAGGFRNTRFYMTEKENINDDIIGAINKGVGILNYVGHGSMRVWGDERVFKVTDAENLINANRLPIFTTFTCLNGYFNHPTDDALAEALLYREFGGIVASIAPSGRSLTAQQTPLANAFFDGLLGSETLTLGEALQQSKAQAADEAFLSEVIHTFNLLGDPALQIKLPSNN